MKLLDKICKYFTCRRCKQPVDKCTYCPHRKEIKDEKELLKYLGKAKIVKEKGGLYNKIILKHPDGWSVIYPEINTEKMFEKRKEEK